MWVVSGLQSEVEMVVLSCLLTVQIANINKIDTPHIKCWNAAGVCWRYKLGRYIEVGIFFRIQILQMSEKGTKSTFHSRYKEKDKTLTETIPQHSIAPNVGWWSTWTRNISHKAPTVDTYLFAKDF